MSKVGKDKLAWTKADEYLTELMDSDTMLTLANTDEAFKRAENFMQRQDKDVEKPTAFVCEVFDDSDAASSSSTSSAVAALQAKVKASDQKVAALQAKLD